MITENERFIEIQGILAMSDIHPADCIKINDLIIELSKENRQLKYRIDKALKLIKENVKDEYGIIDVAVVWEIESVLEGGKVVKD
ncbi:MAG: hypothetical protein IJ501_06670 [Bacilli bacterium]|nr:hypothetical protein [Bacilli bacterium]